MTLVNRVSTTLGASVLAFVLSVSAASAGPRRVYVGVGPPAPIVEVRVVAPGPTHVWVGGYHRWDGRAYVWTAGRWATPPRAHAAWVPGHWQQSRRGGWGWGQVSESAGETRRF